MKNRKHAFTQQQQQQHRRNQISYSKWLKKCPTTLKGTEPNSRKPKTCQRDWERPIMNSRRLKTSQTHWRRQTTNRTMFDKTDQKKQRPSVQTTGILKRWKTKLAVNINQSRYLAIRRAMALHPQLCFHIQISKENASQRVGTCNFQTSHLQGIRGECFAMRWHIQSPNVAASTP